MTVVLRRRGDDIPLLLALTDSAGVPINITALAELYVYVVHSTQGTTLVKFSKAGTGGFTALTWCTIRKRGGRRFNSSTR